MKTSQLEHFYSPGDLKDSTTLLFLTIFIEGRPIRALIDTGASRTFLGPSAVGIVRELGISIETARPIRVRTATGQQVHSRKEVGLTLTVGAKTAGLRARILPRLGLECVLGIDFLRTFGVNIDFADNTWLQDFPATREATSQTEAEEQKDQAVQTTSREMAETAAQTELLRTREVGVQFMESHEQPGRYEYPPPEGSSCLWAKQSARGHHGHSCERKVKGSETPPTK
ncbi:hypothetical protein KPH14_000816 [Odynerus spinipes]|uniref:Peptidase A2 domain-containing protein n=1 Tax=Odynerus spinipes TaxID=1348599 RepID=A0AAD9R8U6_9HYME|nr:hypothetical protein KPH14_000816 [Odynerus spinipes]